MNKNLVKYPALALAAILLASFAMAGSANAGNNESCKYVDNVQLQGSVTLEQDELWELGIMLYDMGIELPDEVYEELMELEYVTITVDGRAHINMKLTEGQDAMDIKLHVVYHGTILIQTNLYPDIMMDFKNAQLMLHVSVTGDCEDIDLNANFHTNGVLVIGDEEENIVLNLDTHIKIVVHDGEIMNLKIALPEWICEA
ncbi:MAG: hypothetical protein WC375_06945 [Methanomassiliicoccales archaeon]